MLLAQSGFGELGVGRGLFVGLDDVVVVGLELVELRGFDADLLGELKFLALFAFFG